jgi:hypothetical protein
MKRIESIEDEMRGVATYEFPSGQRVCFDKRMVEALGLHEALKREGLGDKVPTERVPVMQYGRRVGTMPPDFDPLFAKSRSFLYDYRPGDLRREGEVWIANRTLGASDLDLLVGFEREQS